MKTSPSSTPAFVIEAIKMLIEITDDDKITWQQPYRYGSSAFTELSGHKLQATLDGNECSLTWDDHCFKTQSEEIVPLLESITAQKQRELADKGASMLREIKIIHEMKPLI